MHLSILHIVRILFIPITFIGILSGCKSKKQEIPPFGEVDLQVLDENKQPVDSANLYLYNSQAAFDQAVADAKKGTYNGNGSIAIGKIIQGKLIFPDLPSNTEYWVLAHDTSGFFEDNGVLLTGYPIYRDNADANFYIPAFQNGTKVTANVNLAPAFSLLKFDTDSIKDALANSTPAVIQLGDSSLSGLPSPYKPVRKGTLPYLIRSSTCLWTGAIDALGGKVVPVKLASCAYGTVQFSFPSSSALRSGQHIDIYLGQNKSKPILILKGTALSGEVVLAVGKQYSYYAEMNDTLPQKPICVWEGLITPDVSRSSNSNVSLSSCE